MQYANFKSSSLHTMSTFKAKTNVTSHTSNRSTKHCESTFDKRERCKVSTAKRDAAFKGSTCDKKNKQFKKEIQSVHIFVV